jgi:hypothetical protein
MTRCGRYVKGWLVDEDGDWGTVTPVDPSHPFYASYQGAYQKW